MDIETIRLEAQKSGEEQVGPYRSAAVWEFIGQTFQKGERLRATRYKKKRRFSCYAQGVGNIPGSSCLSKEVLTTEEAPNSKAIEEEVMGEWGKYFSGMI